MIRHRGHFPRTIWQQGAIFSNKKSREDISLGKSFPQRKTHRKTGNHLRHLQTMEQKFAGSELNRLTHGSIATLNAHNRLALQHRKTANQNTNFNNLIDNNLLASGGEQFALVSEFDKQSNIFSRQHQVILQTTEDQQIHLPQQQQPLEIKVENENESKIGNELKLPPIVSPKVQ